MMSRDINNPLLPEAPKSASEIDKKIAALRQRLATDATAWSASANALFTDLATPAEETEDDVMLVLLVQDALRSVDVPRKYPKAYRRLLANGRLRQNFLDLLTALDPNQPSAMPPMPKPDLSFLHTAVSPQPTIRHTPSGWQVAWQLLSDYLTRCFPASLSPVYRSAYDSLLDEQSVILLEDEFTIARSQLNVLLEVNLAVESPDMPTLLLSVAAMSGAEPPPLQAKVTWGSYQATAVLDAYGQASFPPLEVATVLDESGQSFSADLRLLLEPTTA
jgi:hypothetical protein